MYILDIRDKLYELIDTRRQKSAANEDDNNKCTASTHLLEDSKI